MPITIASIMNLMGPDMMVILLIVLLLFGAKKLPELARGMGRAVKEFGAARDEVERNLSQSGPNGVGRPNCWTQKTRYRLRDRKIYVVSKQLRCQKELYDCSSNS